MLVSVHTHEVVSELARGGGTAVIGTAFSAYRGPVVGSHEVVRVTVH